MEETIKEIMEFDKKCKLVINDLEEKKSNMDEDIAGELELKKEEVNNKYQYKINFQKSEYDKRIKQRKEEIDKNAYTQIQKWHEDFKNEKEQLVYEIINSILKRG